MGILRNSFVLALVLVEILELYSGKCCTPVETLRVLQTVHNYEDTLVVTKGLKLSYGVKYRRNNSETKVSNTLHYTAAEYKSIFVKKFGKSRATRFDWNHTALWIFSRTLDTEYVRKLSCNPYKVCSLEQVVGACGSVEFRTPQVTLTQKHIPEDIIGPKRPFRKRRIRCGVGNFTCGSGECKPRNFQCDNEDDCLDGSDEDPTICDTKWMTRLREICQDGHFQCSMGACIEKNSVCDSKADCPDGSDEFLPQCPEGTARSNASHQGNCASYEFSCHRGGKCISASFKCDGDTDCDDGSDEDIAQCRSIFPHKIEGENWMQGFWVNYEEVLEPLLQVGGQSALNATSYVCKFVSLDGASVPGRLTYDPDYNLYNCYYPNGRYKQKVRKTDTHQVLLYNPRTSYRWANYRNLQQPSKLIGVLGTNYELYFICNFYFEYQYQKVSGRTILLNGFFKPTTHSCISTLDNERKSSDDFYVLIEL